MRNLSNVRIITDKIWIFKSIGTEKSRCFSYVKKNYFLIAFSLFNLFSEWNMLLGKLYKI